MRPESAKLLRSAYSGILQAINAPQMANIPNTLEGVRVVLNDLMLQECRDFANAYYQTGHKLAMQAYDFIVKENVDDSFPMPPTAALVSDTDTDSLDLSTKILTIYNDRVADKLSSLPGSFAADLLEQLVSWELGLYAHRMTLAQPDAGISDATTGKLTAERFEAYLKWRKPEWGNVKVKTFRLQAGGFSKITALADLTDDSNGNHSVVVRAEPAQHMLDLDGMAIASEYPVLCYAFKVGLPAAEPLLIETDSSHLGLRFILSRKMPGATLGNVKGSDKPVSEKLLKDVVDLIARIAQTPVDRDDPLIQASHFKRWVKHKTLAENTRDFVRYWRQVGIDGHAAASPLVTRGFNWLLANVPEEEARPNLIHGDIGFHNILIDEDRISALLDWENSRYGDTAEDLTLFISSTANQVSRDQLLQWYREAGGPDISEYRLRYFDVYQAMKLIVAALVSSQRVQDHPEGNLHLAVFGLQYLYYIGKGLNDLIKSAERAKASIGIR